ncbi:MFS transporter [Amaricoccus sp.]|uniref:MFS transporter n=1 Tax=Amaricoccus sp. TaxID=1872485 RepID=UPI001B79FB3D|nr:MFS transporter [Amaricoccus sp.]MBP7003104.1 MFS transporter [Amaricoccus sp.]
MAAAGKGRSIALLVAAVTLAMSLWFVSAAALPELVAEAGIGRGRAAALSAAVQLGFVVGALALAAHGTADRFDPRRVLAVSALLAAGANLALVAAPVGGAAQVGLRALTGAALAGVYPVGMKIAVGWGARDRGLLVALIVAAVTLGSATPYLLAFAGGADWRVAVVVASGLACLGAGLGLAAGLGPGHARARGFDPGALRLAWTDRRLRLAYAGYFGHMWELYAFWGWIAAAATAAFAERLAAPADAGRLLAFAAIGLGALSAAPAGWLADRIGKARVARGALLASGCSGLAAALAFHGPAWLFVAVVCAWGLSVVADSAQFSALVADAAPPERAGSLMTLQTAIGFLLTVPVVQAIPAVSAALGWPATLALMAVGPAAGAEAMRRLIRLGG